MSLSSFRANRSFVAAALKSVLYSVENDVATVTLNRPAVFNAIDEHMPTEIKACVEEAHLDDNVKVIVLTGAGTAFCSGYDLKKFAEAPRGSAGGSQAGVWDPYIDYRLMAYCNDCYMSLFRSLKPTICKINGPCVAGGTDIALACDLTWIAEDAPIGYPPARLWGCPTSAMWVYRLGAERAKRLLFTGDLISGAEAARIGLIGEAVPRADLDAAVQSGIDRIRTVPTNQLFFQKQVINNALEMMGLFSSQRLAVLFDGMSRHTPEGVAFQRRCEEVGFKQAIRERDSGTPGGTTSKL